MSWGGEFLPVTPVSSVEPWMQLFSKNDNKRQWSVPYFFTDDAILIIQSALRPVRGCLEATAFLDLSYWTRASAHVIVAPISCCWNGLKLSRTWTNWNVSNMENGSPSCLSLVIKTYRILYTCARSHEVDRLKSVTCVGFFCIRLSSLMSISNALETSAVQSAYL